MTTETVVPVREVLTKFDNGDTVCIQIKDFWAYVLKKRMTKEMVLKLPSEKREEFFMKWKHGMSDINANWEFEYTLRSFLNNFKDMKIEEAPKYFQESLRLRREFEVYCDTIKTEINMWTGKKVTPPPVAKDVQDLLDMVGGSLIDPGTI